MDLTPKRIAICSLITAFFLTACGGSGSDSPTPAPPSKSAPVASADSASSLDNEAVTIDVLANDSDAENDPLTISSISVEPEHGTVSISQNSIIYTPVQYYVGSDNFGYQVSDGALTSEAQVSIISSQSYTLSGVVTDGPIADTTVTVNMAGQSFSSVADADGNYTLNLVFSDANAPLLLNAKGATENQQESVELVSYLGNFADFVTLPDASRQLSSEQYPALNITQFSTANYLLVVENNNGDAPTDMEAFRQNIDKFTATEMTTLSGFIKLLVDNPNYTVPENQTSLSVLQNSNDNSIAERIANYLSQQELTDEDGQPSAEYLADLQIAIEQSIKQQTLVEKFTTAMLAGKEVISLFNNIKEGYLPASADVYQFAEDGQGTFYYPPGESNHLFTVSENFSWNIENGQLNIAYADEPRLTEVPFYDYAYVYSIWGFKTAQEIRELYDQGYFFQLEVSTNAVSEKISVLSKGSRQALILSEKKIEHIVKINDIYTATASEIVSETRSFLFNPETIFTDKTTEDIVGTWAISLDYTFVTEVNGEATDPTSAQGSQFDIVTFNQDGTASGLLSKVDFSWQFSGGAITLETDDKKFIITPHMDNGTELLASIEYYDGSELQNITVLPMIKSNITSSTQVTGTDLVTALPLIYAKFDNKFDADLWQGNTLKVETVFGFHLDSNFQMRRIFTKDMSGSQTLIPYFHTISNGWAWSESENVLLFDRVSSITVDKRAWHIISTNESGRLVVVEYWALLDDANADGITDEIFTLIPPRLVILEPLDLSQYEQAWAKSLELGTIEVP